MFDLDPMVDDIEDPGGRRRRRMIARTSLALDGFARHGARNAVDAGELQLVRSGCSDDDGGRHDNRRNDDGSRFPLRVWLQRQPSGRRWPGASTA